jgi:putative DNA primase/helicase
MNAETGSLPETLLAGIWPSIPEVDPQATMSLTDLGNAKRFALAHRDTTRYCHARRKWLNWDGRRWEFDDTLQVFRKAKATAVGMLAEALAELNDDNRKDILSWQKQSESEPRIRAMISLAQSEEGIPIQLSDLDRNPWLFNCSNGTLDLKAGALRAFDKADLNTKISPVAYDPEAKCPLWDAAVERIFDGNEALISYLQRWVGYCLTGSTAEHALLLNWGSGANGKTTIVETLRYIFADYCAQADFSTFLSAKNGGGIRNDIARLQGARLVTAVESEKNQALAESLIKSLTGGDQVTARFLYCEAKEFKPAFKLWLATNHRPVIRGTDTAIWRRIRLLAYMVQIPVAQRDKELVEKLKAEASGILAWAVRGLREWQKQGLNDPPEVMAVTEEYRTEEDFLKDFFEERCIRDRKAVTLAKELYKAYCDWCQEVGEKPVSRKAFSSALDERGFTKKSGAMISWRGVRLKDALEVPELEDPAELLKTVSKSGICTDLETSRSIDREVEQGTIEASSVPQQDEVEVEF